MIVTDIYLAYRYENLLFFDENYDEDEDGDDYISFLEKLVDELIFNALINRKRHCKGESFSDNDMNDISIVY